jgi:hypothetical protein
MSFFMGLATGLAKSVDTQLKESIERTRDNIDMVSKWRLKKAEEREKERRTKDKEIETLIKDAAYVISGNVNNVDAQNMAAALYKERGLSGFTDDINFMKQQKEAGVGVRPIDYIKRANEDVNVKRYGLSEIVRSLSDAESSYAPSDMIFPKGTIRGSGLIGAIAPGFDVTAAGGQRAAEQMQQIGLTTTPTAPSLSFDRYTFDREGLGYATKSVNEKLSYLRNIMDDPSADPETVAEAGQRLDDLLNKSMTGEESSAIQAINLKLSRMSTQDTSAMTEMQFKAFDAEQDALIKRRQGLEDTIALRDAKTEKERLAIQANIAFREDRVEDGFRLMAQSEDYGTQVTNTTIINRIKARASRLQSDEDYMNSTGKYAGDGFAEDRTKIQIVQANEEELMGVSFDKVQAFATQIRQAALAEFKAQHPGMYKDLNITTNEDGTIDSTSFINALTNAKGNVSEKYNEILNSVIQRYKTIGAKHNVSENTIDSAVMLLTGKGLPAATGGTDAVADTTAAGQTDAALAGQPPAAGTDVAAGGADAGAEDTSKAVIDDNEVKKLVQAKVQLDELTMDIMRADYPNTLQGALDFIGQDIFKEKEVTNEKTGAVTKIPEATANEILAEATGLHDDNFTNTIRTLLDPQNEVNALAALDAANAFKQGDVGITIDADARNSVVQSLVQDIPNLTVEAANYIVNKAVQNRLDAEPKKEAENINLVTSLLKDKKFLTGAGRLAGYRRGQATDYVARVLNVSTEEASRLINKSLAGPDDGIDAFDIETISPGGTMSMDEMRGDGTDTDFATSFRRNTIIGQIFGDKDRSADVDYGALSTEELTALISDDASTNAQVVAASQELTKRSGLGTSEETSTSVSTEGPDLKTRREMGVDTTFTPDVIFRGMGSRIPYKKIGDDYYRIKDDGTLAKSPANTARKSILENPNRRDVERVGGVEDVSGEAPAKEKTVREAKIPTQDMNMSDVKAMSDVALIARYISGNMTDDMRNEFRRRLDTPSFVDQAAAIIDKVNAEKKSLASRRTKLTPDQVKKLRSRTSKQQVPMARGGLMRR